MGTGLQRFGAATFVSGSIGAGDSKGRAMVGTRDQAEGGAAAGFGRGMVTNVVSNALDVAAPGARTLLGQVATDFVVGAGGSAGGEVLRDAYDSVTGTDSSGGRSLGERMSDATAGGAQNVVGSGMARVFHARPGPPTRITTPDMPLRPAGRQIAAANPAPRPAGQPSGRPRGAGIPSTRPTPPRSLGTPRPQQGRSPRSSPGKGRRR